MFRRSSLWGAIAISLFVVACSRCPDEVLGAEIKTGDRVVTTGRARIVRGTETVATAEAGTELTVTAVRGNWVGVQGIQAGKQLAGWVSAAQLNLPTGPPAACPRELAMQPLPAYRIEPPDVLQIEMLKLVPLPPYRAEAFDTLQICVVGTIPEQPIDNFYLVAEDGSVNLGPPYGRVRVAGLTVAEIEQAIEQHLRQILVAPEVSVQLAQSSGVQEVSGQYLVGPDGTVNLRRYGAVQVAGKTIVEARVALDKHLAQYFDSPAVSVDMVGYNSKVYYVITEGAGLGDNVQRVPITGSETVLDAISHIGGLSQLSSTKVWIARPVSPDSGRDMVLPVDWNAITRRGATATNYQVLPGDRVFIAEDRTVALTNHIARISGPVERVMGVIALGTSILRNLSQLGGL